MFTGNVTSNGTNDPSLKEVQVVLGSAICPHNTRSFIEVGRYMISPNRNSLIFFSQSVLNTGTFRDVTIQELSM